MTKTVKKEVPTPFWNLWKIITSLAIAASSIAGTAFVIGQKWEEAKANLEAAKAFRDCTEKIEAEKRIATEFKEKYFSSIKDNLSTLAENLKQK